MISIKEQIKDNLEYLNEQQLRELVDFSNFLKIRSKIQNSKTKNLESFLKFSNEDIKYSELGLADYNKGLLEEDRL